MAALRMDFQIPKITHEEVNAEPGRLRDRAARPRLRLHVRQLAAPRAALLARGRRGHLGQDRGRRARVHDAPRRPRGRHRHHPQPEAARLHPPRRVARGRGSADRKRARASSPPPTSRRPPTSRSSTRSSRSRTSRRRAASRSRSRSAVAAATCPAEGNRGQAHTIGVIPVDSMFSPIRRVSYDVEAARVGQRTDYDKLILDVTTNGSIDPKDAIAQAAEILIRQLAIFTDLERIEGFGESAHGAPTAAASRGRLARARDGELPDRGARARRPLVQLPEAGRHRDHRRPRHEDRAELAAIPNFGKKSIEEVKETLAQHGLGLRGDNGSLEVEPVRHARTRQEARSRLGAPQGSLLEPCGRADRARADQDDRHEGEGGQAARRADDHARPARRPARAPAGDRLPALARRRPQPVRRGRARGSRIAPAATRGSSSSARARATRPRWCTSSSSTTSTRRRCAAPSTATAAAAPAAAAVETESRARSRRGRDRPRTSRPRGRGRGRRRPRRET